MTIYIKHCLWKYILYVVILLFAAGVLTNLVLLYCINPFEFRFVKIIVLIAWLLFSYYFVCYFIELFEILCDIPYITITDEFFSYREGNILRKEKIINFSDVKEFSYNQWNGRGIEPNTFITITFKDYLCEENKLLDTTSLDTKPEDIRDMLKEKLNSYNIRATNAD